MLWCLIGLGTACGIYLKYGCWISFTFALYIEVWEYEIYCYGPVRVKQFQSLGMFFSDTFKWTTDFLVGTKPDKHMENIYRQSAHLHIIWVSWLTNEISKLLSILTSQTAVSEGLPFMNLLPQAALKQPNICMFLRIHKVHLYRHFILYNDYSFQKNFSIVFIYLLCFTSCSDLR